MKTKSQAVQSYLGAKNAQCCAGVQEAVQILGLKFSSEDEKSGKVTWEQKAHSAVQCSIMQCNALQCTRQRGPLRAAPACTGR